MKWEVLPSIVSDAHLHDVMFCSPTMMSARTRPRMSSSGRSIHIHYPFARTNVASYDQLIFQGFLRHDPNFRYCLRPGCPHGQIHDSGAEGNNIFSCNACDFRVCTAHDAPMHYGETCEQYNERMRLERLPVSEQEQASRATIEKSSKKCPGPGCAYSIQKDNGCDHMTCKLFLREIQIFIRTDQVSKVVNAALSSATNARPHTMAKEASIWLGMVHMHQAVDITQIT